MAYNISNTELFKSNKGHAFIIGDVHIRGKVSKLLAITIVLILLTFVLSGTITKKTEASKPYAQLNYSSRQPITIESNVHFDAAHGVTGGSGTEAEPWIIEGWDINGADNYHCISIKDATDHFIIRNCYIHDSDATGIRIQSVQNANISNNIINMNNGYGIWVYNSINNTISNNTMSYDGVYIEGNQIEHWNTHEIDELNTVNGKPVYYWKNQVGNVVPSNGGQVILANCTGVSVEGQYVRDCEVGISIAFSSNILVNNNNADWNYIAGISLYSADNCTLKDNQAEWNYQAGIQIKNSENTTIENNTVSHNTLRGIHLIRSNTNTVRNNTASNNSNGIYLSDAHMNYLEGNDAHHNEAESGIYIVSSNNNTVIRNSLVSNQAGIKIAASNLNNITGNSALNNKHGIYLWLSDNVTISKNSMVDGGLYIRGGDLWFWNTHNIDETNTVNGKKIYYWKNRISGKIPDGAGQVVLANCTHISIENQSIGNAGVGIALAFSRSNTIANNIIYLNAAYGIFFEKSFSNKIYHNDFIDNECQAHDYFINEWDDEYPSGGNYWSDYTGQDSMNGPDQKTYGSDGIGDSPYVTIGGSMDNYPLIDLYSDFAGVNYSKIISRVELIIPYWTNSSFRTINSSVNTQSEIDMVSLWHRFSDYNKSWSEWKKFGDDMNWPWSWNFNFPEGEGYYELYSIGKGMGGIEENPPIYADALCAFDITPPVADAGDNQIIDQDVQVMFKGLYSHDNIGVKNYSWSFIYDGELIILYEVITFFTFSKPGLYTVVLNISDMAGNKDSGSCIITVIDTEKPKARAGKNITAYRGGVVTFNGSSSTDNDEIINYSWSYVYNNSRIILYGESVNFTFWTIGEYNINLEVEDVSGNVGTGNTTISVLPNSNDNYGYIITIIIFVVVLIIAVLTKIKNNR